MRTALRRYYRGDELVGMRDGQANATRYYHFDHQGTTQCLTDKSGTATDRFASDAWGAEVKRTGSSINRHWYVGNAGYYSHRDPGIDYVRRRWYHLSSGRFISRDPSNLGAYYVYTANSPVDQIDPTGLWQCRITRDLQKSQFEAVPMNGAVAVNTGGWLSVTAAVLFEAKGEVTCTADKSDNATACPPSIPNGIRICQSLSTWFLQTIWFGPIAITQYTYRTPTGKSCTDNGSFPPTCEGAPWTYAGPNESRLHTPARCPTCVYDLAMGDAPGWHVDPGAFNIGEPWVPMRAAQLLPISLPAARMPTQVYDDFRTWICDYQGNLLSGGLPVLWSFETRVFKSGSNFIVSVLAR